MVLDQLQRLKESFAGSPSKESADIDDGITLKTPLHVAVTMEGIATYCKKYKIEYAPTYQKGFALLKDILEYQTKSGIPLFTIQGLSETSHKDSEHYSLLLDALVIFLQELGKFPPVHKHKVKISVLGKWYALPGKIIDPIKSIIDETKDYDSFFFNLCINYNGQEEIVDACKLIGRQVRADKLDPEGITKDIIKEHCYSSYFLPPQLMIKTGVTQTIPGLLLWDSSLCKIHFTKKYWPELKVNDISKAIKEFSFNS